MAFIVFFFFFQAEDGIRDGTVTGVQTCALPILLNGYKAFPFLEHDGEYWGPPGDDRTAVRELERLRRAGAAYIVFAWSSFWWLDYYVGFRQYLRAACVAILENERLIVFHLSTAE